MFCIQMNLVALLLYYFFIMEKQCKFEGWLRSFFGTFWVVFPFWLCVFLMLLSIKERWTSWVLLVLQHCHTLRFATGTDLLICSVLSAHLLKLLPSNSGVSALAWQQLIQLTWTRGETPTWLWLDAQQSEPAAAEQPGIGSQWATSTVSEKIKKGKVKISLVNNSFK